MSKTSNEAAAIAAREMFADGSPIMIALDALSAADGLLELSYPVHCTICRLILREVPE